MIEIVVVSRQGAPVAQALSAAFGPSGGTIGRAPSNTLVLDDPERTVSRVHAQVLCREGRYVVVDRGSNPMQCDGQPVGTGNEAALNDGSQLVIGGFVLAVRSVAAAAAAASNPAAASATVPADDDPFADLLAGLAPAGAAPAARPQQAAGSTDALLFPNPLEDHAPRGASSATDPFADLLGRGSGAAGGPSNVPNASYASNALEDFSDLGAPAAGKATSIDALFGGAAGGSGSGGDPLALSPLGDPLMQPDTGSRASEAARSDHVPVERFGYVPPLALTPSAAPELAFDDESGRPVTGTAVPALDAFADLLTPPAAPSAAAAPVSASSGGADADLLAALLKGLGHPHQAPETLTPGLMERIGVVLRSATEGTLHLLLARQEFKREVRAEVTLIASKANNPLKFSPTAEIALAHLLGPGMRGFMPPEAAMRDAYDDLRAHQFGVMVGMRAALAHVIARFEPAELEKKIASKSALDSLFAANRKARLWDQFVALYGGIAADAEDDFHSLFGKAFVEAYEAQMKKLKAEAPRRSERE